MSKSYSVRIGQKWNETASCERSASASTAKPQTQKKTRTTRNRDGAARICTSHAAAHSTSIGRVHDGRQQWTGSGCLELAMGRIETLSERTARRVPRVLPQVGPRARQHRRRRMRLRRSFDIGVAAIAASRQHDRDRCREHAPRSGERSGRQPFSRKRAFVPPIRRHLSSMVGLALGTRERGDACRQPNGGQHRNESCLADEESCGVGITRNFS